MRFLLKRFDIVIEHRIFSNSNHYEQTGTTAQQRTDEQTKKIRDNKMVN